MPANRNSHDGQALFLVADALTQIWLCPPPEPNKTCHMSCALHRGAAVDRCSISVWRVQPLIKSLCSGTDGLRHRCRVSLADFATCHPGRCGPTHEIGLLGHPRCFTLLFGAWPFGFVAAIRTSELNPTNRKGENSSSSARPSQQ